MLLGAFMGWLLQQGSHKIETKTLLIWMTGLSVLVGSVFYIVSPYLRNATAERHISLYGLVMTMAFSVLSSSSP